MAKVWVVEVRVLWLHSAAWMALLLAEGGTAGGGGKGAFAVGGCGLEGGGCEGQGEGEGEESCEEHGCVFCVDVWVGLRA